MNKPARERPIQALSDIPAVQRSQEPETDIRKLHLGCGERNIPGFYQIDALPYPHVDRVASIERLDFVPNDSVELIYACCVLEHIGRHQVLDVLTEWYRVLGPQGVLRLAVPDFAASAKLYCEGGLKDGLASLIGLICGGQRNPYDFHKMIFDEPYLSGLLLDVGFREVRRWDWRATEHAHIDDFSQAYLPHMEKESGTHMCLNLEATK